MTDGRVGGGRPGRAWVFILASSLGFAAGCSQNGVPFNLATVVPDRAYTDGPVILRVGAGPVRPALRANVGSGDLKADLTSVQARLVPDPPDGRPAVRFQTVEWDAVGFTFWVKAKDPLQAGTYTMELVDPEGRTTRFVHAFEGLGPDLEAPKVTVNSLPASAFLPAGGLAVADINADDGDGGIDRIHWESQDGTSADCLGFEGPLEETLHTPPRQLTCHASFSTPGLDEPGAPAILPFSFRVTAWDVAGHATSFELPLFVGRQPIVEGFTETAGSLAGYQPFTVRGRFFIEGSRALIDDVPILGVVPGGTRVNDELIVGWTPPHGRAEAVVVKVISPVGPDAARLPFTYLGPPHPRDIQPRVGPARGGIRVTVRGNDLPTGVTVYVGATRDTRKPLFNVSYEAENKAAGCLPPGAGTVSVWTVSPLTGEGELPDAFTYQADDAGAATMTDPACL
ncbi:MAG: IPT/TIG domain-containing protein [Haliangium ochraceum]